MRNVDRYGYDISESSTYLTMEKSCCTKVLKYFFYFIPRPHMGIKSTNYSHLSYRYGENLW